MELYRHAHDKTKNIFHYFFTELKPYHLSYSNYKYEAIDIANPSSMQDVCHTNFVMNIAHRKVYAAQWWSIGALRFVSSWRIRTFSLSHARDKTKNVFLYFFTELKTYHLSFYFKTLCYKFAYTVNFFYKFAYGYLLWEYQCAISNAFFRRLMFAVTAGKFLKTKIFTLSYMFKFNLIQSDFFINFGYNVRSH